MNQVSSLQAEQLKEIGSYLRQQREEHLLSLEDIAAMTRIRLSMLEALETGALDRLPELIYVKGFIRRYGEALGLDGKSLAGRLSPSVEQLTFEATAALLKKNPERAVTPPSPNPDGTRAGRVARERTGSPFPVRPPKTFSLGIFLWLGILAGISSGLGYLFLRPPIKHPSLEIVDPSPSRSVTSSPVTAPSPFPVSSPPPARPTSLSATIDSIDSSWLRVKADGETVFEGILKSGSKRTWAAKKILSIRSGNAGGVKISVNDGPAKVMGPTGQVADVTLSR